MASNGYVCSVTQVLFSRHVGELRQGHWFDPIKFDWPSQSEDVKYLLLNAGQKEKDYKQLATELLGNAKFIGVDVDGKSAPLAINEE